MARIIETVRIFEFASLGNRGFDHVDPREAQFLCPGRSLGVSEESLGGFGHERDGADCVGEELGRSLGGAWEGVGASTRETARTSREQRFSTREI